MSLKKSQLPKATIKKLISGNSINQRLYDLPKIHKRNMPFRPIVRAIDPLPYKLAR